jgi:hypothetical protein
MFMGTPFSTRYTAVGPMWYEKRMCVAWYGQSYQVLSVCVLFFGTPFLKVAI